MKNVSGRAKGTARFLAEEFLNRLREKLIHGDPSWEPLSPGWLAYKEKNNLWLGPWMTTGELASMLGIWESEEGRGWYVGFARGMIHKGSGLPAAKLASILEFGRPEAGLPARSLFRKTRRELKLWYREFKKSPDTYFPTT